MKKYLIPFIVALSIVNLFGCNKNIHEHAFTYIQNEDSHVKQYTCGCQSPDIAEMHTDNDKNGYCDVCDYNLAELYTKFKTAYANSFTEDFEIDLNNIHILNYHGMINDAHVVSINSSYWGKHGYPNGAYIEHVERMSFRYDISYKVYIVYNDVLYTAKSAYENNIIDFDGLCKVFGLHTSNIPTFHKEAHDTLKSCMELKYQEKADLYELGKYYGEYNGYYAVSYNYFGMQLAVTANDYIKNLNFGYGYQSNHIRFMNGTEMYTIHEAFDQGIINDEDLYELFEIHSKSEEVDAELITQLLTPAYELCLKYKDDFDQDIDFKYFYLTKYYGKYGNSYIYSLESLYWIRSNSTSASPEEIEIMEYGFNDVAYVLNDGKLYTLDQAVNSGIITNELKEEIRRKYYRQGL